MENREETLASVNQSARPSLKRTLGPVLLLLIVTGDMIGAGIIALVGVIGGVTGGAIWTAFLLALTLAIFTAFAYAELVTKYPEAGGTAAWINFAFGKPFLSFMVTFAVVMSGVTSASALSSVFATYFAELISVPAVPTALVFVVLVSLVNFWGISESGKLNAGLTIFVFMGFLLIVVSGLAALFGGVGDPGRILEFKPETSIPVAILAGAALAFYPLIGFEDSVNFVEETKDPRKSYPIALFGGLLLAGSLYIVLTLVASMVVPTETLVNSDVSLLEVVNASPLKIPLVLFTFVALAAVTNTALVNLIMASRLLYGMSTQRVLPGTLSRIHSGRRTPWVAILTVTPIALVLVATGGFQALASTTVVLLLLVFIAVSVAVLVLKRQRVDRDHFHTPKIFPILGIVTSIGLLTQIEGANFLRAGLLLLVGVALWGINALGKRTERN